MLTEPVPENIDTGFPIDTADLAALSHELRTPLNAIIGFAQLLQLVQADPARFREYAPLIEQAGHRLSDLVSVTLELLKKHPEGVTLAALNAAVTDVPHRAGAVSGKQAGCLIAPPHA